MKRSIPWGLTLSRFALGPILLWAAYVGAAPGFLVCLLVAALLSDIFDGVLARRWGTVTAALRGADSCADVLFYGCVAFAVAHLRPELARRFRIPLIVVSILCVIRWTQDLIKYGRLASYHAILSRATGAALFVGTLAAFYSFHPTLFLGVAFVIGVACHLEAMTITAALPHWTHDVSGIRMALQLARATPTESWSDIEPEAPQHCHSSCQDSSAEK